MVRRDLPPGTAAAQIVHAAGESAAAHGPLAEGTHAVVLEVDGPETLAQLLARLRARRQPVRAICEPDAPYHGALMALGLPPAPRQDLPGLRALSGLHLYRGGKG